MEKSLFNKYFWFTLCIIFQTINIAYAEGNIYKQKLLLIENIYINIYNYLTINNLRMENNKPNKKHGI